MSEDENFGLESAIQCHFPLFTTKFDALTVLIHWSLMSKAQLRCVGSGDHFSVETDKTPSEILPSDAFLHHSKGGEGSKKKSETKTEVTLKYRGVGQLKTSKYHLRLIDLDGTMMVNMCRVSDEKVATSKFNVDKTVNSIGSQSIKNMFFNLAETLKQVLKDVIEPLFPHKKSATEEEEKERRREESRGWGNQPPPPPPPPRQPPPQNPPPGPPLFGPYPDIIDPPGVGGGDLDPFGDGGGGGMFMDPFGAGRGGRGGRGRGGRGGGPNFDPPFPGFGGFI